jgi:hypothetical protein
MIRVYRGHWKNDDPPRVPDTEALELLKDPRWYSFRLDDPFEWRLWYENVENIKPEFR